MSMFRGMGDDLVIKIGGDLEAYKYKTRVLRSKELFCEIVDQAYLIELRRKYHFGRLVENAENGFLESQMHLADLLYEKCINGLWDCKEAYNLYKKIADRKFSNEEEKEIIAGACYRLGVLYFSRDSFRADLESIKIFIDGYVSKEDRFIYLKKAASLGNSDAKICLYSSGKYHEFIKE